MVNPGNTDTTSTNSINITWDNSNVVFADNENSDIVLFDTTSSVIHFKGTSTKAKSLKADDNFVINKWEYYKVVKTVNQGSEVLITVGPANLTDVAKDANLTWNQYVNFDKQEILNGIKAIPGSQIQVVTTDSVGYSARVGSYLYSIGLKLLSGKVRINITCEKIILDTKVAKLTLIGEVRNFRTRGKIEVVNHQLMMYDSQSDYLEGEFDLKAVAAGSGSDLKIEVPLRLFRFPIAGIPILFFDVRCLVVMNALLPAGASTLLDYKFKFVVDEGFQYDVQSKKCTPSANVRTYEMKENSKPQSGAAGAMAMSWGLAVPRFEIRLGLPSVYNTTIGWVHSAYLIGGDYTFTPPCQQSKARFIGAYGWSLGAFGLSVASGTGNLWDYEKVFLKAGDCP